MSDTDRIVEELRQLRRAMAAGGGPRNAGGIGYGWVGDKWQKNPLAFGYSGTIRVLVSNTDLTAGTNTLAHTAVPAGEIWNIENIAAQYVGTVTNVLLIPVIDTGGILYVIGQSSVAVTGDYVRFPGPFTLKPGDILKLLVAGATLHDDAYLFATGYRVDIDQ